jgi:hypothetical protein
LAWAVFVEGHGMGEMGPTYGPALVEGPDPKCQLRSTS